MEKLLLEIDGSGATGDCWTSRYLLNTNPKGGFKLRFELDFFNPKDDIPTSERDDWSDLKDGADLYEALASMLSEDEYSIHEQDLDGIASQIAELDQELADQFLKAPETLEQRYEDQLAAAELKRQTILEPYRTKIDEYILTVLDHKLRYGYGSYRTWVKRFIEDYVISKGNLPSGEHVIEVKRAGGGYSGGRHDFGNLSNFPLDDVAD